MLKKGKTSANKLMHSRGLLKVYESDSRAQKTTDEEIAKQLHSSAKTVARIHKHFVEEGLEATLLRKPHSNSKSRKRNGDYEALIYKLRQINFPSTTYVYKSSSGYY